jgi:hypothetical protein
MSYLDAVLGTTLDILIMTNMRSISQIIGLAVVDAMVKISGR